MLLSFSAGTVVHKSPDGKRVHVYYADRSAAYRTCMRHSKELDGKLIYGWVHVALEGAR